jgi:protein-L-isoaspartate(D-aspartate) O-methyltransferase
MDYESARHNMIEQQIRPWEVLDPVVLDLLAKVKREDFVPPVYRSLAFRRLGDSTGRGRGDVGAEDRGARLAGRAGEAS